MRTSKKSLQQLAAIAIYMLEGEIVTHDDKLRKCFSETLYQLDTHHQPDNSPTMGKAKDYSIRDGKVGRRDLQKLGGAFPDIVNMA